MRRDGQSEAENDELLKLRDAALRLGISFPTIKQWRQGIIRRVSARNQLVGRIDSVRISGLMAEVRISTGGQQITSIITGRSASEMQLKPGQTAAALIKATEVMILRV
jgi:molybdopterin-binding protein